MGNHRYRPLAFGVTMLCSQACGVTVCAPAIVSVITATIVIKHLFIMLICL